MLFTGTYHRNLDDKDRVAIPKSLRDGFESSENATLYLAPSTDGALAIYPETAFRQLAERSEQLSPNARKVREYARLFFARATAVHLGKQGPLRIPSELVELAQLGGEVVLVGVRDHAEIWPCLAWENYVEDRTHQYDQIAESAFELPQRSGKE